MEEIVMKQIRAEVDDLLSRLPVMEQRQFLRSLYLLTGMEGAELTEAGNDLVANGIVILTENGYVTNKNSYDIISKDPKIRMRDYSFRRLGIFEPKTYFLECIECYNIVLDLFPISKNFYLGRDLFHVTFTDPEKNRIYEVIRIPNGQELLYEELLVKESSIYKGKIGGHIRDATRRIAIVESESCIDAVPRVGFTFICQSDSTMPKGFKVLERRKEDLWKDAIILSE